METKVGDRFKSALNGEHFIVKRIVRDMVVLESLNGKKQILTGVGTLKTKSFYQKKEEKGL